MNESLWSKDYCLIKHATEPEAVIFLEESKQDELTNPVSLVSEDGVIHIYLEDSDELQTALASLKSLKVVINDKDGNPVNFFEVAI
ncbi:hypothetical protein [Vibrio owensii]|uniref:hypothetical protein n=1 Tax=Vibrio owensii TaxID=696485 RepID=UPI003CC5B9FB